MLVFRNPFRKRSKTLAIVVHYARARYASAEVVHKWHLEKGWSGIGYASVVRTSGNVEEGRPHWAEGAHVYGFNEVTVGTCLEGDFRTQYFYEAQREGLINELVRLKKLYPTAILTAHNWLTKTDCPALPKLTLLEVFSEVENRIESERRSVIKRTYERFKRILKRRSK